MSSRRFPDEQNEWLRRIDTGPEITMTQDLQQRLTEQLVEHGIRDSPVTQAGEVPMPGEAQLLYPERELATAAAEQLGLEGVHEHELDGEAWFMPGETHDDFQAVMNQEEFAGYADFDACVRDNSDKDDPEAYCASIMRQVKGEADTDTAPSVTQRAEFSVGEQVMWEFADGEAHGVVREVVDGSVALPNGAERDAPAGDEVNYVLDEWDDAAGEWDEHSVVKSGSELDESTADLPEHPSLSQAAVTQRAEFDVGNAVRWSWQGNPVHGRVAEVREQATVSGNTITGTEGERDVYVIDEWDEEVKAYRRENVAKPEDSLQPSQKDLPPRAEDNYVNAQAWESLTTPVSESMFTPREFDHMAHEMDGVAQKLRANEWLVPDHEDPLVYKADIPEKYLEGRSKDFFVPNAGMADAARQVKEWREEHGDVAGGASDGEGARRATQIIDYHDRGEPLAIEYWREIKNFHSRKHAQGAHELADENQQTPWEDAGYAGHKRWGGDAGMRQAERVMDVVEDVDSEAEIELTGAVASKAAAAQARDITERDSNRVDLSALTTEEREAVEADHFHVYGKANIEQWDDDTPPTYIQMEALDDAMDRYLGSETAPGIISRHHQDIPVGVPVESFEFDQDTTLEIDDEVYEFEAGDTAESGAFDRDDDGQPELWLAADISNDTEMGKKTRVLSLRGELDGFSVTVHRNEDEMTQEGRVVTDVDLHAVTIGTDDQIKNPGSEYDVAGFKSSLAEARRRIVEFVS